MTITGMAADWRVAGDNWNEKIYSFCPICGTPVYLTFAAMPDLFAVHAASLDDPSRFNPTLVTYGIRGPPGIRWIPRCRRLRRCRPAKNCPAPYWRRRDR